MSSRSDTWRHRGIEVASIVLAAACALGGSVYSGRDASADDSQYVPIADGMDPAPASFIPVDDAVAFWQEYTDRKRSTPITPVGGDAIEIHRIEAGIPRSGFEIADEYLPAETKQLERAVSVNKGCYLGQEVVERMRSREVVARQLCGLLIEGETVPPIGAGLTSADEKLVGTLTSVCRSIAGECVIGLGYVKTALSIEGTQLHVIHKEQTAVAVVTELPITALNRGV